MDIEDLTRAIHEQNERLISDFIRGEGQARWMEVRDLLWAVHRLSNTAYGWQKSWKEYQGNDPVTEWDLISDRERERLESLPLDVTCSRCGQALKTEGEFTRHYTINDVNYPSLGRCRKAVGDVENPS